MSLEPPIEPAFQLIHPFSLQFHLGGEVVFASTKRWLHPLFDLELFLAGGCDPVQAVLADRITGLAAAHLMANLGIKRLRTQVLSRLAVPVLERYGIETRCAERVDRIQCATESLLLGIQDDGAACALLRARRDQVLARS